MHRILVAEDEPRIAAFMQKGLSAHGFAATVAEDGASTLAHVWSRDVDLVLLDLGLPDVDGLTILRHLRVADATLPVIVVSASDAATMKVPAMQAGAQDYVTKPFRFDELLTRIRSCLERDHRN